MTDQVPLSVLVVEDEILLATELEYLVEEAGCRHVGHAMRSDEAVDLATRLHPDLALVDVHLQDGPTGVDVARAIAHDCGGVALFMTANVKRLPPDFAGACGVIGKPYSEHGVRSALSFLAACLRQGQAPGPAPVGLELAPAFAARWGLDQIARASQVGLIDVIGTGAALCSMTSFTPQLLKIWRERDASSVSLRMYAITCTGFALWVTYGVLLKSFPIIGANTVCLLEAFAILILKWRFERGQLPA